MAVTVNDIIHLMETIAPPRLAEKWDNCGLQIGKRDWTVQTILTALDPTPGVISEAIRLKADLLITHHPLFFAPLKWIDLDTPTGNIIAKSLEQKLSIYAAHTNLDSVAGGLNDILASRLELLNITALEPSSVSPEGNGAFGTTRPQGLGRKGELRETINLRTFALDIKKRLALDHITMIGNPELPIQRVALCTGSGSSLLDAFYSSAAQVYVSGDFRYHDARTAEANNVGLIDIGHFASEHLMVAALQARLKSECDAGGFPVMIHACNVEKNPYVIL